MKLKNIYILLIAPLLLVACSKDDNGPEQKKDGKAYLSIAASATGLVSRAETDIVQLPGEDNINNLTALVFDESGVLIGRKWQSTEGSRGEVSIENVEVEPVKVHVALVANANTGDFSDVTTYDLFKAKLVSLSSQAQGNLSMSSAEISSTVALVEGSNYIGYGSNQSLVGLGNVVLLTRVPARVDIGNILTDFRGSSLEGRSVRIDAIYLTNVKNSSYYYSPADWGVVEDIASARITSSESAYGEPINDANPFEGRLASYYICENSGSVAPTTLNVRASLLAADGTPTQTKLFTQVVNPNGQSLGYSHNFIKRNYVYRLNITFSPKSFDDTAYLNVQVQIADWRVVRQGPVID